MERSGGTRRRLAGALGITLAVWASAGVLAQGDRFQFIISVADAEGRPVTDLTRNDILMSEKGIEHDIIRVEPYHVPVRLTIAVDNGPLSRESLSHYRSGLTALVKTLPADVEVTLITISPQPRMVVRPTTNRQTILRGVNGFAPENEAPRFTDALVEYSERLRTEVERTRRLDFVPVLVMISTTVNEAVSYEVSQISRALGFLKTRKAKVYIASISERQDLSGFATLNENRQALIAIPTTELTGGRYEAIAISNRLATLLPEFGRTIAALHRKHANQVLVTVQRQPELSGPLQSPRIEVRRPGLTGQVSLDGLP